MALELIPFPISMVFAVVFGLVWIVVLYKLRRRGRVYSMLFRTSLIIGILLLFAIIFSIIAGMLV
jgi:hypothetical protein